MLYIKDRLLKRNVPSEYKFLILLEIPIVDLHGKKFSTGVCTLSSGSLCLAGQQALWKVGQLGRVFGFVSDTLPITRASDGKKHEATP